MKPTLNFDKLQSFNLLAFVVSQSKISLSTFGIRLRSGHDVNIWSVRTVGRAFVLSWEVTNPAVHPKRNHQRQVLLCVVLEHDGQMMQVLVRVVLKYNGRVSTSTSLQKSPNNSVGIRQHNPACGERAPRGLNWWYLKTTYFFNFGNNHILPNPRLIQKMERK